MAEEVIYSRMYSGQEGWWNSNTPRTSSCCNGSAVMSASMSCSTEFTDMAGGFSWAALAGDASLPQSQSQSQSSSDESAVSNNSLSFQGAHRAAAAAPVATDLQQAVSSPAVGYWNKKPLLSSTSAREESGGYIHNALFQEGSKLSSTGLRGGDMCGENNISSVVLSHNNININQGLPQYQHHYESLLRSLLEPEIILEPGYYTQPLPADLSPPQQQQQQQPLQQVSTNVSTSSANRLATSPIDEDLRLSSPGRNVVSHALKESSNRSNRATKSVSVPDGVGGLSANLAAAHQQPPLKKPRIETPSPLPTFKVRKEKMGDRITALQQLVSPFGKTDTASVLTEAIEYIKFLHDQVGVLSAPYLNSNGNQMLHLQMSVEKLNGAEGPKRDLGSRGLCLMPVSSTYAVASEIPFDFWAPTFGGISFN